MGKIKVGIFFDGTGNNGINANSIGVSSSDSYISSSTNIFKLYQNYKYTSKKNQDQIAVYIEGIGTIPFLEDAFIDQATGDLSVWSGYSGSEKIKLATQYINKELIELNYQKKLDKEIQLEFNIFGFSRGAALARHYANQLKKSKSEVYLNLIKIVEKNGSILNGISINFIGLYDTVESFLDLDPNAKEKKFDTTIQGLDNVNCIFQIQAEHECRYNFPFTSIFKSLEGSLVSDYRGHRAIRGNKTKLIELLLPGNHADIGGSYLDLIEEIRTVELRFSENACQKQLNNIRKDEKWNKLISDDIQPSNKSSDVYWRAISKRSNLRGHLQLVYLKLMLNVAIDHGCDFDKNKIDENYNLPCDLVPIYRQVNKLYCDIDAGNNKDNIFKINRNTIDNIKEKYIHISANWDIKAEKSITPDTKPIMYTTQFESKVTSPDDVLRAHRPAENWIRMIIFQN